MNSPTLEDIVAQAVAMLEAATSGDEFDEVWAVVEPVTHMGRPALAAGIGLLAGSVEQRQAGCAILGALCYSANNGLWSHEVGVALAAAAAVETDDDVAWSIAKACEYVDDQAVAPLLITWAHHHDRDVRKVVSMALLGAQDFVSRRNPEIAAALQVLMQDEWDEIRDWATFGLGTQLDDDSDGIREALVARLDDPHVDTRHEALIGLARRRDPRGLKATLAFLERPEVWRLSIKAAAYHARPLLLPALLALRDDEEDATLDASILACDPAAQAAVLQAMSDLLHRLQSQLVPPLSAALHCPWYELGTELAIEPAGRLYDLDALLLRGGSVDGAVECVLADLSVSVDKRGHVSSD